MDQRRANAVPNVHIINKSCIEYPLRTLASLPAALEVATLVLPPDGVGAAANDEVELTLAGPEVGVMLVGECDGCGVNWDATCTPTELHNLSVKAWTSVWRF